MYLGMILTAAGMLILGSYYFLNKRVHRKAALTCKAAATFLPGMFLLLCVEGGITEWPGIWIFAAVLLYMAADVLLECRFIWGAVCFSMGHICMIAAALTETFRAELLLRAFFFLILFFAAAYIALRTYIPHLKHKKLYYPAVGYIGLLSMMGALTLSQGVFAGGVKGICLAAGGISFVISDILLGMNRLGKHRSMYRGAAVLILYYTAVFLFVCSNLF